MERVVTATFLVALAIGSASSAEMELRSSDHVADALRTCDEVAHAVTMDRMRRLDLANLGVHEAEAVVAAEPDNGRAHLALFCNLAKQCELSGLSWRVFDRLQRAKAVIERAHRLAPKDPDVLVAHGSFLRHIPSVVGGDRAAGLALLRQAVAVAPDHVGARLALARALVEDGAPDARAMVYEALALAKKLHATNEQADAAQLLADMSR